MIGSADRQAGLSMIARECGSSNSNGLPPVNCAGVITLSDGRWSVRTGVRNLGQSANLEPVFFGDIVIHFLGLSDAAVKAIGPVLARA